MSAPPTVAALTELLHLLRDATRLAMRLTEQQHPTLALSYDDAQAIWHEADGETA